jgi:hypothetical protein
MNTNTKISKTRVRNIRKKAAFLFFESRSGRVRTPKAIPERMRMIPTKILSPPHISHQ